MPPHLLFSPKTLQELCLNEIVQYLGRECLLCDQIQRYQYGSLLLRRRGIDADIFRRELETYFDVLPPLLNEIVRQHLTDEILKENSKSFLSEPEICFHLLAIVLSKDVKSLELCDKTHVKSRSPIWPILMKKCTGLRRFVITKKMVMIDGVKQLQPLLKTIISNCPTLTELVLKDIVRGQETLAAIGRSCPNLKLLDISGSRVNCVQFANLFVKCSSKNLNVEELIEDVIEMPCNPLCSTLEVLVLDDSRVKDKGCALALKLCPNLTSFGNFTFLPGALTRLYGVVKKPPPLNITQAFYRGPSHTKLKVLSNCCPKLKSLHIGYKQMRQIMPSYVHYKHLLSLSLENVQFETFLACTTILPQLVELKLSTTNIDVGLIGQHCQNLEKLWLQGEILRYFSHSRACTPFAKLQKLKVQCMVYSECLGHIVKHAYGLQVINVVRVKDLNDAVFTEWFLWNPLQNLEMLMIRYAELTRASVDLLLEHCPHLIRLGELGGWDIRSWECRRLKDLVIRENYQLNLLFYSRNADRFVTDMLGENTSSDNEL